METAEDLIAIASDQIRFQGDCQVHVIAPEGSTIRRALLSQSGLLAVDLQGSRAIATVKVLRADVDTVVLTTRVGGPY